MQATLPDVQTQVKTRKQAAVIDCDIHNAPADDATLYKYLPDRWQDYHRTMGLRGHYGGYYPRAMKNAARHDSWPPNGKPPGSDLAFMRDQLLDAWDIEYGILNPLYGAGGQVNLDYGAALASAINDWQLAEFVEPEPRLKASLVVAYEDGDLAAAEIDRLGSHPGCVQVLMVVRTQEPLGKRKYWKMYEAAVRNDLPLGIHFGGAGNGLITGAGAPSHYIEDHAGMPQAFWSQVTSMVYGGVFAAFPDLKVVLIEGAFAWLPPLMWRLDRMWERMGAEIPEVRERPSDIIRRNFWVTTQPMEEPTQRVFFRQLLDQMDMDDQVMFATDYPHWDFDAPDRAFPVELDAERKRKFMADNARALYGLGEAGSVEQV